MRKAGLMQLNHQIMDEEIVQKFVKREGNADAYYAEPEDLTVPHK